MSQTPFVHRGDLFTSTAHGLAHGANTAGRMGKGVAALFRTRHPDMYAAYQEKCRRGEFRPGMMLPWEASPGQWVYNLATQDRPGPHARLEWIEESLTAALRHADLHRVDIVAMPQIGCGLGGLAWERVGPVVWAAHRRFWANVEVWALP